MKVTRRDFIATTAIGSASLALDLQGQSKPSHKLRTIGCIHRRRRSSSAPPMATTTSTAAMRVLTSGGDTLDAVMQVITGPEDDPNDDSVGLGGLPNEDCVVELDACCMHGPTRMAGSVAGVRRHQERFAAGEDRDGAHRPRDAGGRGRAEVRLQDGLPASENLLTERSRKTWQLWRETMSNDDWWGPGLASPKFKFPDTAGNVSEYYDERIQQDGEAGGEDRH